MSVPSVGISRADGNTGGVKPSTRGICALIAPASSGTHNQAESFARPDLLRTEFGDGQMAEYAAYLMPVSQKPIVAIRPETSTDGAYSALVNTAAGTAVPVAGGTEPDDDFNVVISFPNGGALGTTGITYTFSLDGGKTTSKVNGLGTSLTITIPNTGISVTLGIAADTILAGQTCTFTTTAPQATNADLPAALEALRVTSLSWELLLIAGDSADEDTVALADSFLASLEPSGRFRVAILNVRRKGATETEGDYAIALAAIRAAAAATTRVVVCCDGGDIASPIRGIKMFRPASLAVAARACLVDIQVEPAQVKDGPLAGISIKDQRSNPKYHDEALFPGPDDNHFTALRSFDGKSGAFVDNTNLFSEDGSDYVYLPHARVMNRASEIVFGILTEQLSSGVRRDTKVQPGGAVYIFEDDAASIDALVQVGLKSELQGRVTAVQFTLSRTDDIGANTGATLSGELQVDALVIVKGFEVVTRFVRSITTA